MRRGAGQRFQRRIEPGYIGLKNGSTVSCTGFHACGQSSAGLLVTASETALDEAGTER